MIEEKRERVFNQNISENNEAREIPVVSIDAPDVSNQMLSEESTGSEKIFMQA